MTRGAHPSKYPPQLIEEIPALREQGLSCRAIAREILKTYGVRMSPGAISHRCLLAAADPAPLAAKILPAVRPGPAVIIRSGREVRRFEAADDAVILKMEREGASYADMGRALNRHGHTIKARLATLARHEARREQAEGRA